jgi:lipoprotein-releasing system permease protein
VELLQRLGARVTETVLVSSGNSVPVPFKIVGVFKVGIKTLDEGTAYGSLADVQKINGTPSQVNEIAVRVTDIEEAASIAKSWTSASTEKVQSWDQLNANFLNVVNIQNATKTLMIAVILIVASFGIYNILNMTVTQKRKEIAILRSMGFEPYEIISLFVYQGLILGVVGGLLGEVASLSPLKRISTLATRTPGGALKYEDSNYLHA